jgi:SAM-dependent methyltransferase
MRYEDVLTGLRDAYDGDVAERDATTKPPWKIEERQTFLDRLRAREARTLVDIGAGTGQDSAFFRDSGIDVLATDASPAMVAACRAKRLTARLGDVRGLRAETAFDAAYSMNCLLHVPNADLAESLASIRELIVPGGLVYLGLWGGDSFEGVLPGDELGRFFSFRTDGEIRGYAEAVFDVVDFHTRDVDDLHFQSLTLVRPLL